MNHDFDSTGDRDNDVTRAIELSPAGRARQSAMLGTLVESMRAVHRRRRGQRRAAAMLSIALFAMGAAVLAMTLPRATSSSARDDRVVEEVTVPTFTPGLRVSTTQRAPLVVRVATDPAILDRYTADPPRIVQRVGDEELLRALASIGRPAGLIRAGDVVRLTSPVTDDEVELNNRDS